MMGRGKKGRGAPALSLFPSYHAHLLFLFFFFYFEWNTQREPLRGGVGGGEEVKRHFFFKDIAGKMVRHESTNIKRQEN